MSRGTFNVVRMSQPYAATMRSSTGWRVGLGRTFSMRPIKSGTDVCEMSRLATRQMANVVPSTRR